MQVALGPDEIGLKRGGEGIALPADSMDFGSRFAHDGVAEADYEGLVGRKTFQEFFPDVGEDGCSSTRSLE